MKLRPCDSPASLGRRARGHAHARRLGCPAEGYLPGGAARALADDRQLAVLVHNAAHLGIGHGEACPAEQLARFLATTVLGTHRLNQAAWLCMRAQDAGLRLYVGRDIPRTYYPHCPSFDLTNRSVAARQHGGLPRQLPLTD